MRSQPRLLGSTPSDAQAFMSRVRHCSNYESIQASTPAGVRSLPIFPGSKILWHGVVHPDDIEWIGEKPSQPHYLVMVQTPKHERNQCDWWWFSMAPTIEAIAEEANNQKEELEHSTGTPAIASASSR